LFDAHRFAESYDLIVKRTAQAGAEAADWVLRDFVAFHAGNPEDSQAAFDTATQLKPDIAIPDIGRRESK
jgi:hypothetical protein